MLKHCPMFSAESDFLHFFVFSFQYLHSSIINTLRVKTWQKQYCPVFFFTMNVNMKYTGKNFSMNLSVIRLPLLFLCDNKTGTPHLSSSTNVSSSAADSGSFLDSLENMPLLLSLSPFVSSSSLVSSSPFCPHSLLPASNLFLLSQAKS